MESVLDAMRHFWRQSSGSVDLNHAALGRLPLQPAASNVIPLAKR
jgi:hypothetical protein